MHLPSHLSIAFPLTELPSDDEGDHGVEVHAEAEVQVEPEAGTSSGHVAEEAQEEAAPAKKGKAPKKGGKGAKKKASKGDDDGENPNKRPRRK